MSNVTPDKQPKKSKLEDFSLGFEYNRSFHAERHMTKLRSNHTTSQKRA